MLEDRQIFRNLKRMFNIQAHYNENFVKNKETEKYLKSNNPDIKQYQHISDSEFYSIKLRYFFFFFLIQ